MFRLLVALFSLFVIGCSSLGSMKEPCGNGPFLCRAKKDKIVVETNTLVVEVFLTPPDLSNKDAQWPHAEVVLKLVKSWLKSKEYEYALLMYPNGSFHSCHREEKPDGKEAAMCKFTQKKQ